MENLTSTFWNISHTHTNTEKRANYLFHIHNFRMMRYSNGISFHLFCTCYSYTCTIHSVHPSLKHTFAAIFKHLGPPIHQRTPQKNSVYLFWLKFTQGTFVYWGGKMISKSKSCAGLSFAYSLSVVRYAESIEHGHSFSTAFKGKIRWHPNYYILYNAKKGASEWGMVAKVNDT